MEIETNLDFIKNKWKEKEKDNWKFRSYLKNLDIKTSELDRIVHKINNEVAFQIDCTECANCCQVVYPILDDEDIVKFSTGLNKGIEEFKSNYLKVSEDETDKYNFTSLPCPFLRDNKCAHYIHRSKDCESFPHLNKEHFSSRLMVVIDFYSICPIVFNVYEQLKDVLWRRDWRKSIKQLNIST
jgi:Fe-S-cluster containining protein